jgi:threonine dehydrogenase-like Zn-dependent dehydrogenase
MNRVVTLDRIGELSDGEAATLDHDRPAPGHAIVRVRRVGLCGTDFHAYRGRQPFVTYPRILGHELGVEVIAVGAAVNADRTRSTDTPKHAHAQTHDLAPGDRCAVEPYLNCGVCHACRAGRTNCCVSLRVLGVHCDGGLQEWIELPIAKLHRSRSLSFDELALVEPLSIGAHAVRRAQVQSGELVLVIGSGPIGYATMAAACAAGARVWAMDVSEDRVKFCADRLPLAGTTLVRDDATAAATSEGAGGGSSSGELNGERPTAVFDATGNAGSMTRAFDVVPAGGRLIFVGLVRDTITFDDPEFHRRELTLFASRNATAEDFRQVMTWMESARLNAAALVTHRIPFDRLVAEFPTLLAPDARVFKTLVELPA